MYCIYFPSVLPLCFWPFRFTDNGGGLRAEPKGVGSLVVGKPGFKLLKVGLAIKKKGIGYISCWVVSNNNHVYPILFLSRNIYTHTYIYIYIMQIFVQKVSFLVALPKHVPISLLTESFKRGWKKRPKPETCKRSSSIHRDLVIEVWLIHQNHLGASEILELSWYTFSHECMGSV